MRNFPQHLKTFFDMYQREDIIELYNEFSVYYRLGNHLENLFNVDYKIQFIRFPQFFDIDDDSLVKSFLDIVVFDDDLEVKHAIEVVYIKDEPRLEKLFEICTGLRFMEQIVGHDWGDSFVLLVADIPKDENNHEHYIFSGEIELSGMVQHPHGDQVIELEGSYTLEWHNVDDHIHYAVIPIRAHKK